MFPFLLTKIIDFVTTDPSGIAEILAKQFDGVYHEPEKNTLVLSVTSH